MTIVRCAAGLAAIVSAMLVQATVVGPLVYPVPVSLPLILVVGVAVLSGPSTGIALGFGAGLLADLTSLHPVGVLALVWLGAGVVAGRVGGVVMAPGPPSASERRRSSRRSKLRRSTLRRSTLRQLTLRQTTLRQPTLRQTTLRRPTLFRPTRSSQRPRRTDPSARTSRWRAQALLTGLIALGTTAVSVTLIATLDHDVRALPAALVLLIPTGLLDAMVAVVVLALARAMLASPALRPVTPVRLGGEGPVLRLPMDVSTEIR